MTDSPLPTSFGHLSPTGRSPAFKFFGRVEGDMPVFTADQMRDYAAACVAAERERCARIIRESYSVHGLCCSDCEALADLVAGQVERQVRALVEKQGDVCMKILSKIEPQPPRGIKYMLGGESWLPADKQTPIRLNCEE